MIGKKLPELTKDAPQDLPRDLRLFLHNTGAIMGEQDLVNELTYIQEEGKLPPTSCPLYSGTLKCTSQRAKVYMINKEYFLYLKASTDSHLLLINQVRIKTKRHCGGDLREKPIRENKNDEKSDYIGARQLEAKRGFD